MTKKQFALIFAVWLFAMLAVFARANDVGLAQSDATCQEARITQKAAEIRLGQIIELVAKADQADEAHKPAIMTVLKTEANAVYQLKRKVEMWLVENCRDA
jgi:hypothetical protein